jgi:thioester reductase-like protein
MATFLTGSTGYIGSHLAATLLEENDEPLNLLVRSASPAEANERLWRAMQLHLDFPRFFRHLRERIHVFRGDLTEPRFGLSSADYDRLCETSDSILHCAASLNRKSERVCASVNLRGTLEVILLAQRAHARRPLRRLSYVSTVAVAGERRDAVIREEEAIDWRLRDYDPYARTKKFAEQMIRSLLPPDLPALVFRPSIVLGDSRRGETTQFDMVRAFVFLAGLPVLPLRPEDRIDIVPVEWVARSIVALHLKPKPLHAIYHLSAGTGSQTFREVTDALARARGRARPRYAPWLRGTFSRSIAGLARARRGTIGIAASRIQVFLPYLYWNTVFDNHRVVEELGCVPTPFSHYSYPLYQFSTAHRFSYPYRTWPSAAEGSAS